jgi:non-ribosomal peptide synthetase component E (peptide arylation enzyme)
VRIDDLLRRNALQWAERTAVIDSERELTWAELDRETDRLANVLLSRGYREQERVLG